MEDFSKWSILQSINTPEDLKALPESKLPVLAAQIRDYLVYRVGENGGHLASNLGIVELTIAIHRVFSAPRDHIIFDVGHQSYVHKLLTGRKADFDTLREPGGISGFTRREESAYDAFGAGHSSTAISAALGFAEAERLHGSDAYTIAVVGDGALSGGLSYEGLNNCRRNLRFILIINENEMSISRNKGRLADHLSHLRSSRKYIKTKEFTSSALRHIPLLGKPLYLLLRRVKRWMKHRLYDENIFEHMGIRYLGPANGNDIDGMIANLQHAKKLGCSVILHVKTQKGKGYPPAEKAPNTYHGLPPRKAVPQAESFSGAFGKELCKLAQDDPHLCAITAAMSEGTGLSGFAECFPKRFFDVGIAEGHAVTFAAGLAAAGEHPVVALYSTFIQRAFDNVLHDVALQRLPVTLCIDRAGLNARDGVTHHGIYDVAMLSVLPELPIYAPVTLAGLRRTLALALAANTPTAIRYPCGGEDPRILSAFYREAPEAPGVRIWQSSAEPASTIVTYGRIAGEALAAAELLEKDGIGLRILLCEVLSPYPRLAKKVMPELCGKGVLFLEEGILHGGFAENLAAHLANAQAGTCANTKILAIEDGFCIPKKGESMYTAFGLDAAAIARAIKDMIGGEKHDQD